MSTPLRLVLARHGQTPANVERILDTRLPGPGLTALGRDQAAALGVELAGAPDGPVTALHHSRAARAQETAGIVGAGLGLEPRVVDGVHEVQAGDLEGRNDDAAVDEFRAVFDAWQVGELDRHLPGGESGHQVLERFRRAVDGVVAEHPEGGTVVLVSHGATLRLGATDLLAAVGTPPPTESHVANCGRVVLERGRPDAAGPGPWSGGWRLVAWRHDVPGGLPSSRDATG